MNVVSQVTPLLKEPLESLKGRIIFVEELVHVVFDEFVTPSLPSVTIEENILEPIIEILIWEDNVEVRRSLPKEERYTSSHP